VVRPLNGTPSISSMCYPSHCWSLFTKTPASRQATTTDGHGRRSCPFCDARSIGGKQAGMVLHQLCFPLYFSLNCLALMQFLSQFPIHT
jgi:hypothetical protein